MTSDSFTHVLSMSSSRNMFACSSTFLCNLLLCNTIVQLLQNAQGVCSRAIVDFGPPFVSAIRPIMYIIIYNNMNILDCDKQQKLFFYIDVTNSNFFDNFCPLIVIIQMLVAAFNPSATSGTKISALLFPDISRSINPSPIFDMDTLCFDAVQGPGGSLRSLLIDYGVCLDNGRDYDSTLFPSSCGESMSAVKGLREIHRIASGTRNSTEGAILMITDGIIVDDAAERTRVLSDLNSVEIRTLIAAGIGDADVANLRLYTSSDNILVGTDPVQLGIDIVNKMEERGIICRSYGNLSCFKLY